MESHVRLYKTTIDGRKLQWECERNAYCVIVRYGHIGGSMQEHELTGDIDTTFAAQVREKLREGYSRDNTNKPGHRADGSPLPMLAKVFAGKLPELAYAQPKLNGVRCIAYTGKNARLISRDGINYYVDHVLEALYRLPEAILDGELYIHGKSLQTISGMTRGSGDKRGLEYRVFDIVNDYPYRFRRETLSSLFDATPSRFLVCKVPATRIENMQHLALLHNTFLAHGYEGTMIRDGNAKYTWGKRSPGLLKLKPLFDTECEVTSMFEGEHRVMLNLLTPWGCRFDCVYPGSVNSGYKALREQRKPLYVRVEYRYLTDSGVPGHAVIVDLYESPSATLYQKVFDPDALALVRHRNALAIQGESLLTKSH